MPTLGDFLSLTKPRVTALVLMTTGVGLWICPTVPGVWTVLAALLGTAAIVGSANALNCWMERDVDRLMERTKHRPLAAGRLAPSLALCFGLLLGALGFVVLLWGANLSTAFLALAAHALYVWLYTPLKRRTPAALLVGAVSGAMPPLLGWTAAHGTPAPPGLLLFGVMFFWQIPHFIAIAVRKREEYRRAGFKVVAAEAGDPAVRIYALASAAALAAATLLMVPLGVGGRLYLAAAAVLAGLIVVACARGIRSCPDQRWATDLFHCSLLYLPLLFGALVLDS